MEACGGGLCLEGGRVGCPERWEEERAGSEPPARPLRLDAGLDFLLEEAFERVIGMAESLYCLLHRIIKISYALRSTP